MASFGLRFFTRMPNASLASVCASESVRHLTDRKACLSRSTSGISRLRCKMAKRGPVSGIRASWGLRLDCRAPVFDQGQEPVQSFQVARPVGVQELVVLAGYFPKQFRLVGGGEISLRMMETNEAIGATVEDDERHPDAGKFAASVVFDGPQPADRQPGKQLRAHVGDAGVCALENQPAHSLPQGQFAGHAAAQRFAQRDDVGSSKALVPQPTMSGLGVEISPFLARAPLAAAIAAVIKNENTRAGFEQRRAMVEPMADVPRVAVAEQINEVLARRAWVGGEKPAIQ